MSISHTTIKIKETSEAVHGFGIVFPGVVGGSIIVIVFLCALAAWRLIQSRFPWRHGG
jgi:hypothetical protein